MSVALKITNTPEKIGEISSTLIGYWQNDIWYITGPFFNDMRPEKWSVRNKAIDFSILPAPLREEVKFFFVKRLTEQSLRLQSALNYGICFSRLAEFISNSYPNANSFVEIHLDKAMTKWRSYLVNHGMSVGKDGHLASKSYETILQQLCGFFESYYARATNLKKMFGKLEIYQAQSLIRVTILPSKFLGNPQTLS